MPDDVFRIVEIQPELLEQARRNALREIDAAGLDADVIEVGSTAVAGVIGKGDLDFLIRVPASSFALTRARLDKYFRRDSAQLSNSAYQGYRLDSPLDVAIQLTVAGGQYDTFLQFLERLRESRALREQYNALKRLHDGLLMTAYRQAKGEFIQAALVQRSTGFS